MPLADNFGARLKQASSLPEILAASFDAFEAIRIAARDHQGQVPELFANQAGHSPPRFCQPDQLVEPAAASVSTYILPPPLVPIANT
jgi:hypothetical protein